MVSMLELTGLVMWGNWVELHTRSPPRRAARHAVRAGVPESFREGGQASLPACAGEPHYAGGVHRVDTMWDRVEMILPQVHLRKPCYDFTFL